MKYNLDKCPFCGSTASVGVYADCDGYLGTIGVFCDNPYCGGAYLGEPRSLSGDYAGWMDSFCRQTFRLLLMDGITVGARSCVG